MSEEGEKILRMQRYRAALTALALAGDAQAQQMIDARTPEASTRLHLFIRDTIKCRESMHRTDLAERVRTRVVMDVLEK